MKQVYDKKHVDKEFQVGDWVYLKLQSYHQTSVERRLNHKLSPRFFGPYRVIAKIGAVAYKLELPPGSRVHRVFHVSLLKRKLGDQDVMVSHPPQWELLSAQEPVKTLATRMVNGKEELMIHWTGNTKEEATWEDKETLKDQFPDFSIP